MRTLTLACLLSLGISAVAITPASTQPAPGQFLRFVAIPITGSFSLTNTGAGNQFVGGVPTLLTPVGTINLTSANPNVEVRNEIQITPTSFDTPQALRLHGLSGTLNFYDSRTASFTNQTALGEGFITARGTDLVRAGTLRRFGGIQTLPVGAFLDFNIRSGALYLPEADIGPFTVPNLTIPVSGGNFILTDPVGANPGTITFNSLLSPAGTFNIRVSPPSLITSFFPGPSIGRVGRVGGVANGTIALNDGRTITLKNQLIYLNATDLSVEFEESIFYTFDGSIPMTQPSIINGRITPSSVSIPEFPREPRSPQTTSPESAFNPANIESVFPQPNTRTVNVGGDLEEYLRLTEFGQFPLVPEDLPEVEQSPLAYSRIHPGVNAYNR